MTSLLELAADDDFQEELRGTLDIQARLLYGLIHARWIVTARGLAKMVRPAFIYRSPLVQAPTHFDCPLP
jgi:Casein kinase II regulatory subunit